MASTRVAYFFDKIQHAVVLGCVGVTVLACTQMTVTHRERMEVNAAYAKKIKEQEERMETPERKAKRIAREARMAQRKLERDIVNGLVPDPKHKGIAPHLISEN